MTWRVVSCRHRGKRIASPRKIGRHLPEDLTTLELTPVLSEHKFLQGKVPTYTYLSMDIYSLITAAMKAFLQPRSHTNPFQHASQVVAQSPLRYEKKVILVMYLSKADCCFVCQTQSKILNMLERETFRTKSRLRILLNLEPHETLNS